LPSHDNRRVRRRTSCSVVADAFAVNR
jgi:hypothetical protein